jgi:hypothetical protein
MDNLDWTGSTIWILIQNLKQLFPTFPQFFQFRPFIVNVQSRLQESEERAERIKETVHDISFVHQL